MSYYSKNCMVSEEKAKQIRKQEKERLEHLLQVTKKAAQFMKKHKDVYTEYLQQKEKAGL